MVRTTLLVLAIFLALAATALAVRLVPAHLQIRTVHPRLPGADELRGLLQSTYGPVALQWLTTSAQPLDRGTIAHSVFLARWSDGRLFEVDAGMDKIEAIEFGELLKIASGGGEVATYGTVPDQIGASMAQVRGLGFTHLHIDHTQGIQAVCTAGPADGAQLFQGDAQATLTDPNTLEGAALVNDACFERINLGSEGLLTPAPFPGMALIPLGGHTACSTMFVFAVNGHLWLLSGDITNTREALLENQDKGFIYSTLLVPEDTTRTTELREWLAMLDAQDDITVVVSHDLEALSTSGLAGWGS